MLGPLSAGVAHACGGAEGLLVRRQVGVGGGQRGGDGGDDAVAHPDGPPARHAAAAVLAGGQGLTVQLKPEPPTLPAEEA